MASGWDLCRLCSSEQPACIMSDGCEMMDWTPREIDRAEAHAKQACVCIEPRLSMRYGGVCDKCGRDIGAAKLRRMRAALQRQPAEQGSG